MYIFVSYGELSPWLFLFSKTRMNKTLTTNLKLAYSSILARKDQIEKQNMLIALSSAGVLPLLKFVGTVLA